MSALQQSFDVPDAIAAIGLIPAGKYQATLASLEEDQGDKDGHTYYRLVATWRLLDGRELRDNLNIGYPATVNEATGRIAREQLQQMAHALGVRGALSDTDQVVGREAMLTVVVNGNYNNIKNFEPVLPSAAAAPGPAAAVPSASNPFGG